MTDVTLDDRHRSRVVSAAAPFVVALLGTVVSALAADPPRTFKPIRTLPIDLEEAAKVSYERDVAPILNEYCFECHLPDDREGGLDVTSMAAMLRGGKELGPSIVPGRPDKSPLVTLAQGTRQPVMPQEGKPLSEAELHTLRQWIAAGAKDDSVRFSREDEAFFEKQIRPVLHTRCLECHAGVEPESGLDLGSRSGVLKGGSRGPAAVPGDPDGSRLVAAIRHVGELRMPRNEARLSDDEVANFETWIRKGLPWPRESAVLTRTRIFKVTDEDRDHWAFRPLVRPTRPKNEAPAAIDAFLLPKLYERGLDFAAPADRHALLRRLTYDLIGYPPTVEEIDAFVRDESDDAVEKVVDRLLASPHFGRRWGRHWLDYTRIRTDFPKPKVNNIAFDYDRYERWVTRCFNDDVPYDWFARVHVAGDLMPSPDGDEFSPDQALAATVPLWGPRTVIDIDREPFVLMDKLDEGIEFLGRSLLGVSLECARCHDHKTDPFSQQDYYALLGVFRSSWLDRVPESARSRADVERHYRELDEASARRKKLQAELSAARAELTKDVDLDDRSQELFDEYVFRGQLWYLETSALLAERMGDEGRATELRESLRKRRAAGARPATKLDERDLGRTVNQLVAELTERGGFESQLKQLDEVKEFLARSKTEKRRLQNLRDYGGYARDAPEVAHIVRLESEIEEVGRIARRPMVLVRSEGGIGLGKNNRRRGDDSFVGDTVLYVRGDVVDPGPVIPRRFPVLFSGDDQIPLGERTDGSGRRELAEWLVEPGSRQRALMARAAVNRVWQQLLGHALCRTPTELGRDGDQPLHPELLDHLASRFVEENWSVKALIREIVLSNAYQQASQRNEQRVEHDPESRLVSSQTMHRLDSEAIENALTAVAFGRPASPDESTVPRGELKIGVRPDRDTGQLRPVRLSFGDAIRRVVELHDAPNPNQIVAERSASLVPTQSLLLMNGELIRPLCAAIADRAGVEIASDRASIDRLFRHLYGRPAADADIALANRFLKAHEGDDEEATHALIHLLLCGNEFLYID